MTASAIITPAIGRSMATGVKRVNNDPKFLRAKLMEVELERDYWKKRALAAEGGGTDARYISASEFARRHGVAVSTITRKFEKHKLVGYRTSTGYIYILASETYVKGKRAKSK